MKRWALLTQLSLLLCLGIASNLAAGLRPGPQSPTDPPAKEVGAILGAPSLPLPAAPADAPTYHPALRRYPYLTDLTGSSATLNWATSDLSADGFVTWGQAGAEPCTAHTAPARFTVLLVNGVHEYQWHAVLPLRLATRYCYRVYLDTDDLLGSDPSPSFWTQLPTGAAQPFSFAVFGDWGRVDDDGQNPDQAHLLAQIARSGARFAVTTGDNGYPAGNQSNYGDLVQRGPDLSAVFGRAFWPRAGATIPLFAALGNHGFSQTDRVHPHFLNWPQDNTVAMSGGRYTQDRYCCLNGTTAGNYPSAWYAFDAGRARFYVLEAAWTEGNVGSASAYEIDYDYHWTPSSAEYQWLAHDLATHPYGLKFAFFHYPLYSDNSTEPSDTVLQGPGSLEGLLNRYGVNIAFTGHAHIYQRNRPAGPQGVVSYITGGGGAKLEPIGAGIRCSATDAYGIGWSYSANGGAGGAMPAGPLPGPPR
jgi:hypothetical protein